MWLINQIAENQKTFGYKASIIYKHTHTQTATKLLKKKIFFSSLEKRSINIRYMFSNKRQCMKRGRRGTQKKM